MSGGRRRIACSREPRSRRSCTPGRCPPGQRKVKTDDPLEPTRCVTVKEKQEPALSQGAYRRYTVPGELSFDYPKEWHLTDGSSTIATFKHRRSSHVSESCLRLPCCHEQSE